MPNSIQTILNQANAAIASIGTTLTILQNQSDSLNSAPITVNTQISTSNATVGQAPYYNKAESDSLYLSTSGGIVQGSLTVSTNIAATNVIATNVFLSGLYYANGTPFSSGGGISSVNGVIDLSTTTGAIYLPRGTTAQRPTTSNGAFRYNTTLNIPEIWNGNMWAAVIIASADGSSASAAATSAQAIKNLTGTTTSGYYWITLNGTPTQVWCDMSSSTAWMLAMRMDNGTTFNYASSYWTNTSGLNETSDPQTNTAIKNSGVFRYWTASNIRMTASSTVTAYTSNPLIFTGFNASLYNIFNAGNNQYDANIALGRTTWLNWFVASTGQAASNFDTQPNCNTDQINAFFTYAGARIGISMNNEGDCATNDSAIGFGVFGAPGSAAGCSAGGSTWNPSYDFRCHGWLWVN